MNVWKMINRYRSLLFVLFSLLLLSACSDEEPLPEEVFDVYAEAWENKDFETMYDLLSTQTKADTKEEDFVDRYEQIYDGISAHNIRVSAHYPEEEWEISEDDEVDFAIEVHMNTMAGEIDFTEQVSMILEEKDGEEEEQHEWLMHWDHHLIFPELDEGDSVRARTERAIRGEIYDRHGNKLASNGAIYEIYFVPGQIQDEQEAVENAASLLQVSEDHVENQLNQSWVTDDARVPIAYLPTDDLNWIESELVPNVSGIGYAEVDGRVYPYAEKTAHLTGYIDDITGEQLEELKEEGYSQGDKIGQTGLESLFEEQLRGEHGGIIFTVGEDGEQKETIAQLDPEHGEDIHLTVDMELQEKILAEMDEDTGTAVALHPKTGEVLSLVNTPAYDPNAYVLGQSGALYEEWQDDPEQPLLNRFRYTFSPGSTFKHITAAIGLETETITPDQERDIEGLNWQESDSWGDYEVTRVTDPGEPVDLWEAIVYSDNIYFAQTALEMGEEEFQAGAQRFGFGEDIPFTYPLEPSTLNNDNFHDVLLADSGYGQGQVQMNPLHLALTYTPFLNEGDMLAATLLEEETDEVGIWQENVISSETADVLLEALIDVVEDSSGTATEAQVENETIAGKTGTAELKSSLDDENNKQYGWFVGFNTEDPQILIAMMIEDVQDRGGSGYTVPLVGNVLDDYLNE